jgi:tetratricopeptide (TPR) repeat protein
MKSGKYLLPLFFLLLSFLTSAQKSEIYTDELSRFNHALQLYQNKDYAAALVKFEEIKDTFDEDSELRARCYYYEAFCYIRLNPKEGDALMRDFVNNFPTSTKRNNAFLEVADYYFKNANYPYALKWLARVNPESLNRHQLEDYNFKYAYGLFATRSYTKSKAYFSKLLDSKKYGPQAKYYFGYIAYKDDDFVSADKYFNEVSDNKSFGKDIPYFLANIRFKTGKFQEAIDAAIPLLEKSNPKQRSEISKIIGESYFNLGEYDKAIEYLEEYKGKKGRWNNTDFYQLGYAYYKQEDYQTAMDWFSKIIDGNNSVSQNAYYHLGECYLRSHKKQEALNAFRNAAHMDFDETIKKDAWLNYAKLSYEIGNPYEKTTGVILDYLKQYPTDLNKDELNELLMSSFISSKDYQGALDYLKDDTKNKYYQKIAFLRGTQLFKKDQYEEAKKYFDLATENDDELLNSRAVFWKAECDYRLMNYEDCVNEYKEFDEMGSSKNTPEYKDLYYNLGYAFFKLKDYAQAGGYFRLYVESDPADRDRLTDANMRLGDSYFALGNYYKALKPYQEVISENGLLVDYAQFQSALCYGYMGDNDKKITALKKFLKFNLKSPLRDDAFYQLGNTYFNKNDTQNALEAYNEILDNYPESSYVPKALLKKGLIYYNSNDNSKSLAQYKKVIRDFPETEEAKEAVANARQIYVDEGRISEYEKLVKNVGFVNVTDKDIDNTLFESAEKQYLSDNLKKAQEGFQKYLKRFPEGMHALEANYYLADTYIRTKDPDKALKHYQFVLDRNRNDFTENALTQLSQIYLEKDNWEKAMPLLKKLEETADTEKSRIFAQSNLMKGNYAQENYKKAVYYADIILKKEKIEDKVRSDAQIIIARSAFKNGDFDKARDAFKVVEKSAGGEQKAEAVYYDALFMHREGDYKNSNMVIQKLASDYGNYRYWGAKGLVIMAKNFYELADYYQATYILENVLKNFADYPDVTDEAKIELQKIKKEQAKTNESVIQK